MRIAHFPSSGGEGDLPTIAVGGPPSPWVQTSTPWKQTFIGHVTCDACWESN